MFLHYEITSHPLAHFKVEFASSETDDAAGTVNIVLTGTTKVLRKHAELREGAM